MEHHRWRLLLVCVVLVAAALPGRARANAGSPHEEGDPTGEPSGALAGMAVERETLTIDLRPLAAAAPARIEAVYQIRNDGAARTVDLVFVAAALSAADFGVWVNDTAVPAVAQPEGRLPSAWKPPVTTPALTGDEAFSYYTAGGGGLRFAAALHAGTNTLRVRYAARATAYSGPAPVRFWQLGYVLAPARDWAAFEQLDVTVLLPSGWRAAATPALERQGDTLTAGFRGLPADALALTAQAPYDRRWDLLPVALAGGAAVAVVAAVLFGVWLGRRRGSFWWLLPGALALALAWTTVVIVAAVRPLAEVPAEQDAWTYNYGRVLLIVFAAPLIFGGGLLLALTGGGIARVVARRRAPVVR